MNTWKLKKGAEAEISVRKGHPWVFGKDLDQPEERAQSGSFVRLMDSKNQLVAFGYGNLSSAISFRALPLLDHPGMAAMASVGPQSSDFQNWLVEKIVRAWSQRLSMGFQASFRVVFSEGDGLPGLIIDRYLMSAAPGETREQVLAIQVLTAGMEKIWGEGLPLMEAVTKKTAELSASFPITWENTFVVERKDVSVRKHEGLEVFPPKTLKTSQRFSDFETANTFLTAAPVSVEALGAPGTTLELLADLQGGQKTGFFLDQSLNMSLVMQMLERRGGKSLKVLDLCSYVGHWSLQLGAFAKARGMEFETALVDISGDALKRASENLTKAGLKFTLHELDVMKETQQWPGGDYDVVIADPPAFVKAKKDLTLGLKAYQKLNTEATKRVKAGGLLVTCSCSGLVSENELTNLLPVSFNRASREGRILCRGNQGADHPWNPAFPEGRYLKMILSRIW